MTRCIAAFAAAAIGMMTATGASGNDALYGDQPGRNAVFVRFINALDTTVSVETDALPPLTLGSEDEHRIGSYRVVDNNGVSFLTVHAKAGDAEVEDKIKLEAGTKMSVVLRKDDGRVRIVAIPTPSELNESRAVLSFINASPTCGVASLVLDPAKVTVFANVPVDGERSRRINLVSAQLSVTCGSLGIATTKIERPEAGSAHSVWLLVLAGRPTLILGTDTLPAWHP